MKWITRLPKIPLIGNLAKSEAEKVSAPKKVYTLFAGVNGSGKTSLFEILRDSSDLGERVNIDEIALSMGSWRDTLVQIKASREAIKRINVYIEAGVSFHQETTLPGATLLRCIKDAKNAGFLVRLYFVGVDSCDTAIERVHQRVAQGGHGIDDSVIRRRYQSMPERLTELLPLCDAVIFYDNTLRFRQIGIMRRGKIVDLDPDLPKWFHTMVRLPENGVAVRRAKRRDLPMIMPIFEEARATMAALGIDQWQNGYPERRVIEQDIGRNESYVLTIDHLIVASFSLLFREEPTYHNIYDGTWLSAPDAHYGVLHRVAVSAASRRRGLAGWIIDYAVEQCRNRKLTSLRIDTHEGNTPMRRMLKKNGFAYCGIIYLETGESRVAYEKLLSF